MLRKNIPHDYTRYNRLFHIRKRYLRRKHRRCYGTLYNMLGTCVISILNTAKYRTLHTTPCRSFYKLIIFKVHSFTVLPLLFERSSKDFLFMGISTVVNRWILAQDTEAYFYRTMGGYCPFRTWRQKLPC